MRQPRAHLCAHFLSELLKLFLSNNTGVSKPAPVWLYPAVWQLLGLKFLRDCKGFSVTIGTGDIGTGDVGTGAIAEIQPATADGSPHE